MPFMKPLVALTWYAAALVALTAPALAQQTPVGTWRIIDDANGQPRALMRIIESNGALNGKIEKLFHEPGDEQNPRCMACSGARKDQPLTGMTILSGLKREDHSMVWSGGEILDPDSGRIYKIKATLADGGRKLEMRGYFGVPLLGRTQTWLREP